MKNFKRPFFFLLFLWSLSYNSGTAKSAIGDCDYQNATWLNERLNDETLCNDCIAEVNVYVLNDTTYIGFIADDNTCSDALTTIYYCDGTEFCLQGGLAGLEQCNEWTAQEPVLTETLWIKSIDCACNCPAIFEPVCGSNGINYTNSCFAECDGEFDYVAGECNPDNFTCDWEDLVWLDSILQSPDICENCIEAIEVYELRDTTFVAFIADDRSCTDALTIVYTCDFEEYCRNGGFAGFQECVPFFDDSDLVLVETAWDMDENCGQNSVKDLVYKDWQVSQVVPNPTSDRVHIAFSSVEKSLVLEVYNTLGMFVKKIDLGRTQGTKDVDLEMSDLDAGVYFLRFKTAQEQRGIRVVKQ